MGKSTISMAIFNSYVKLPEGINFGDATISTPQLGMVQGIMPTVSVNLPSKLPGHRFQNQV